MNTVDQTPARAPQFDDCVIRIQDRSIHTLRIEVAGGDISVSSESRLEDPFVTPTAIGNRLYECFGYGNSSHSISLNAREGRIVLSFSHEGEILREISFGANGDTRVDRQGLAEQHGQQPEVAILGEKNLR